MPSELLPSKRRSVGIGLLNFANGLSTFTVLQAYPYIVEPAGVVTIFAIFGTVSLISAALLWKLVPETRGKTLEAIEKEFRMIAGLEKLTSLAIILEQMAHIKISEGL